MRNGICTNSASEHEEKLRFVSGSVAPGHRIKHERLRIDLPHGLDLVLCKNQGLLVQTGNSFDGEIGALMHHIILDELTCSIPGLVANIIDKC